ncbi:MAG: type II toxin-antitoxin system HicB family antitoxin [Ruminococcaceae bacterium]|nr:type II toxin-antitoxin system HicB family antitoxin [Oscillospiraceae bacterium]
MNNVYEYKGYLTKIEFSAIDNVLHGKIEGINDLVTFESNNISEIEQEFHNAVDDYLALCEELGQEPDKTYKGSFNVRIHPSLHRKVSLQAIKNGESLNSLVEKALTSYVEDSTQRKVDEIWTLVSAMDYSNKTSYTSVNSSSIVGLDSYCLGGYGYVQ